MPNRRLVATLAFATAFLVNFAHAQVHRCQDASGKLVYSDKPCAAGQQGVQIERQRTREEIFQEREAAYNAEMRKQQRNMVERQQEQMERQRAMRNMPAAAPRDPGADWAARKARENAATSAGSITNSGGQWDRAAEAERDRVRQEEARRRPTPPVMTGCYGSHCTDSAGNTYYPSPGLKDQMTRSDGKTCNRNGAVWDCN